VAAIFCGDDHGSLHGSRIETSDGLVNGGVGGKRESGRKKSA